MLSAEVFEKTYRFEERRAGRSMQRSPAETKSAPLNSSPPGVRTRNTAKKFNKNDGNNNGNNNDNNNNKNNNRNNYSTGGSHAHVKYNPANRAGVRSIPSGTVTDNIERFTASSTSPSSPFRHGGGGGGGGGPVGKSSTSGKHATESAHRTGQSPGADVATTSGSHQSRSRHRDRLSSATTPDDHKTTAETATTTTTTAVTTAMERFTPRDALAGFAMRVSNAYKRECTTTTTIQNKNPGAAADATTYAATFVTTTAEDKAENPSKEPRTGERTQNPPPPPPPPRRPPQNHSQEKISHPRQQRLPSKRIETKVRYPNQVEETGAPRLNPSRRHPPQGSVPASLDRFQSPKGVIAAETDFFVREKPGPQITTKAKIADAIMGFTPIRYDQIQKDLRDDPRQNVGGDDSLKGVVSKLEAQFSTPETIEDRSPIQLQHQQERRQQHQEEHKTDSFLLDHYYNTAVANNHLLSPSAISVPKDEKYSRSNIYEDWAAITNSDNHVDSAKANASSERPTTAANTPKVAKASSTESLGDKHEESKDVIRMLFRDLKASKKQESDLRAKLQKSRTALQKHQSRYEENMRIAIKSADDVRANLQRLEQQRSREKAKSAAEISRAHQELMDARQECLRWKLRALEQHPYRHHEDRQHQRQEPQQQVQATEEVSYGDEPSEDQQQQQPERFRDLDAVATMNAEMAGRGNRERSANLAMGGRGEHSALVDRGRQEGYITSFEEYRPSESPKLAAPQPPREAIHLKESVVATQEQEHVQHHQQEEHPFLERTVAKEDVTATTTPATTATSTGTAFAEFGETTATSFPKSSFEEDVMIDLRQIGGAPHEETSNADRDDGFGVSLNENDRHRNGSGGNSAAGESNRGCGKKNPERSVNFSEQLPGSELDPSRGREGRAVSADDNDGGDDDNAIAAANDGGKRDREESPAVMLGGCGGIEFGACYSGSDAAAPALDHGISAATVGEPEAKSDVGNATRRATLNDLLQQLEASKKRLQLADQKWNGLVHKGGNTLNSIISPRKTRRETVDGSEETTGRTSMDTMSPSDGRVDESPQGSNRITGDSKRSVDESDQTRAGELDDGSMDIVDSFDASIEVSYRNYAYV